MNHPNVNMQASTAYLLVIRPHMKHLKNLFSVALCGTLCCFFKCIVNAIDYLHTLMHIE